MSREDGATDRRADGTDEAPAATDAVRDTESIQSQLDLLTLLVAVVGGGLLFGGVAETFAALFALGVAALVLSRIYRRDE